MKKVLIADDERIAVKVLEEEFTMAGYQVSTAYDGEEAMARLEEESFDAVVSDIRMPKKDGIYVLRQAKAKHPQIVVVLITAFGRITDAVEAMKLGADDYVVKPYDSEDLIQRVSEHIESRRRVGKLPRKHNECADLVGESTAMKQVQGTIAKVRDLNVPVLITGETGSGKGVVAKSIHATSGRWKEPFVHMDCASLPENLIENELFGHAKGAFTGAIEEHKGKFELAGDGTIFLDEIGTMPLNLQSKLLNVIQERYFYKIGSSDKTPVRARIIAATNEDLPKLIQQGKFRQDLYFRLDVVHIQLPPLRDRKGDISLLADAILSERAKEFGKPQLEFQPEVYDMLETYLWPGNVRELENAIESAVALSESTILGIDDFPKRIVQNCNSLEYGGAKRNCLEEDEKLLIMDALARNNGHREKTAQALKISRRTLQYKLKKYDLL